MPKKLIEVKLTESEYFLTLEIFKMIKLVCENEDNPKFKIRLNTLESVDANIILQKLSRVSLA